MTAAAGALHCSRGRASQHARTSNSNNGLYQYAACSGKAAPPPHRWHPAHVLRGDISTEALLVVYALVEEAHREAEVIVRLLLLLKQLLLALPADFEAVVALQSGRSGGGVRRACKGGRGACASTGPELLPSGAAVAQQWHAQAGGRPLQAAAQSAPAPYSPSPPGAQAWAPSPTQTHQACLNAAAAGLDVGAHTLRVARAHLRHECISAVVIGHLLLHLEHLLLAGRLQLVLLAPARVQRCGGGEGIASAPRWPASSLPTLLTAKGCSLQLRRYPQPVHLISCPLLSIPSQRRMRPV